MIFGLVSKQAEGLGRYLYIRIDCGEGVVVGEGFGFGAVVAEGGFVEGADDGEGVEDGDCRLSLSCPDHRTAPPQAW
jgi:hypothetical protein